MLRVTWSYNGSSAENKCAENCEIFIQQHPEVNLSIKLLLLRTFRTKFFGGSSTGFLVCLLFLTNMLSGNKLMGKSASKRLTGHKDGYQLWPLMFPNHFDSSYFTKQSEPLTISVNRQIAQQAGPNHSGRPFAFSVGVRVLFMVGLCKETEVPDAKLLVKEECYAFLAFSDSLVHKNNSTKNYRTKCSDSNRSTYGCQPCVARFKKSGKFPFRKKDTTTYHFR